jgi:hypothetical protein
MVEKNNLNNINIYINIMSQSRIFNAPKYKHQEKDDDKFCGWYKYGNLNQVALRVGDSDIGLDGEIRFNRKTKQFEGYNGNQWMILDSSKGNEGKPGKDFNEVIKFVCDETLDGGFIISPTELDTSIQASTVKVRKVVSGKHTINNHTKLDIDIKETDNNLKISVNSKPYIWNYGNINIDDLSILNSDGSLKCYGEVALFQASEDIKRGQIVQIVVSSNKIAVKPLAYNNNGNAPNLFGEAINIAGIALSDTKPKHNCMVCVKGITSVLVSNESTYLQIDNNIKDGNNGLANFEGKVVKTNRKPLYPYIKVGQFIGNHTIIKDKLIPFKVNILIVDD